ncbi:28143_t:CDS:2 [Dentiscutata erythropus]|uniref:28143_t:CDS:1 n=1 Tax=Dentiscutata erythropus TaxID=1348616 RepID=A0A9N9HMU1_9GLOM|nr:28143_t:CDS:2 [Dentiscutata erythropus]
MEVIEIKNLERSFYDSFLFSWKWYLSSWKWSLSLRGNGLFLRGNDLSLFVEMISLSSWKCFGHVHFDSKEIAENFYGTVQENTFTVYDQELDKRIEMYFLPSRPYENSNEERNFDENRRSTVESNRRPNQRSSPSLTVSNFTEAPALSLSTRLSHSETTPELPLTETTYSRTVKTSGVAVSQQIVDAPSLTVTEAPGLPLAKTTQSRTVESSGVAPLTAQQILDLRFNKLFQICQNTNTKLCQINAE